MIQILTLIDELILKRKDLSWHQFGKRKDLKRQIKGLQTLLDAKWDKELGL